MIATYDYVSEIGVFLMGSNFADYGGVVDLLAVITEDFFIVGDENFIRNFDALWRN